MMSVFDVRNNCVKGRHGRGVGEMAFIDLNQAIQLIPLEFSYNKCTFVMLTKCDEHHIHVLICVALHQ